jgi:hypothetical protein
MFLSIQWESPCKNMRPALGDSRVGSHYAVKLHMEFKFLDKEIKMYLQRD